MKLKSQEQREIKKVEAAVEKQVVHERAERILVKEFVQGMVLGFLAGVLVCWYILA